MEKTRLIELIESGQKNYLNKTRLYLAPCMEWYGEEVFNEINKLNYFMCGINTHEYARYRVYYIIDINTKIDFFTNAGMNTMLASHTIYDSEQSLFKRISLWIPKSMYQAYDNFIQGKYSQMYTPKQLDQIFKKADPRFGNEYLKSLALPTLIKHPKRREYYEAKINAGYDDEYSERVIIPDDFEYDSIWESEHEVLNL